MPPRLFSAPHRAHLPASTPPTEASPRASLVAEIEYAVECIEVDRPELKQPGWFTLCRCLQRKGPAADNRTPDAGLRVSTIPSEAGQNHCRRKPKYRKPPVIPLPENDIKVIRHPRRVVAVVSVDADTLANIIMQPAGLTHNDDNQVHIQAKPNYTIISTPHEERAT